MEKRTDEIGKVSQNQLVVAKKLTFIKEGEGGKGRGMRGGKGRGMRGGKGRGMRGKVREADNVADIFLKF